MNEFIDILKVILPSTIVSITIYLLGTKYIESKKMVVPPTPPITKKEKSEAISSIRLQASERIVLFLERINPNSMIMRFDKSTPANVLAAELISNIRTEYEHNLAQQIYISQKAWDATVQAKEEITKLIKVAASKMGPTASGMELAQTIIVITSKLSELPTQTAINMIKRDIRKEL